MNLEERSYSTKSLRPRPFVHSEEDGSLLVIATSWGQPEHAQLVTEEVVKYVNAAKSDVEVTSPFEFMTCLTDEVNYLRIALLIANDILYRGENRSEYFSGVEVLVFFKRGNQLSWAQVGSPNVFLKRSERSLQPLSVVREMSEELFTNGPLMPPMPANLLGLDPTCYIQCGHTTIGSNDQVVLLAGPTVPKTLWNMDTTSKSLQKLSDKIIQEEPESPFWLGLLNFNS